MNPWLGLALFAAFAFVMTLVVVGTVLVFTPSVRTLASNSPVVEPAIGLMLIGTAILAVTKYKND